MLASSTPLYARLGRTLLASWLAPISWCVPWSAGFPEEPSRRFRDVLHVVSSAPAVLCQFADPHTLSTDCGAELELGSQLDLPWRHARQIAPELAGLYKGTS